MTRCNRGEVNLKSSVYNQNGQNYFEQLTAYNSMTSHLRRILLAKYVVDARNKNYRPRRKQLCKDINYKTVCMKTEITNDIIDRLAYDTLHHPADFLRMSYKLKYLCQREDQRYFTDCYNYDVICSRSSLHNQVISPGSLVCKSNKFEPFASNSEDIKRRPFAQSSYKKTFKAENVKSSIKIQEISEHRLGEDSMLYGPTSDFVTQEVNRFSSTGNELTGNSSKNYENFQESTNMTGNYRNYKKNEEIKYAKFVYEITREIMDKGLYTDKELEEIFKKHLEQNRSDLDKNKMLYEIYQLKLALNVSDDSDDEELDDLIHAQELLNISEVRPPTPPKVLNENKLIEKLKAYQEKSEIKQESKATTKTKNKSVVLIDANPELIITERDVLMSLFDADVNPEQAQKICKELSYKSKDSLPVHQMKVQSNQHTMTTNSQSNLDLNEIRGRHKVEEQEKSCTTSDLIMQENKNIQVE